MDGTQEAVGDVNDEIVVTGERARRGAVAFYNGWTERGRHTELAPSPSYYPAANAVIQTRMGSSRTSRSFGWRLRAERVRLLGVVGIAGGVGGGATSEFGSVFKPPPATFLLWNGGGNAQAGLGTS